MLPARRSRCFRKLALGAVSLAAGLAMAACSSSSAPVAGHTNGPPPTSSAGTAANGFIVWMSYGELATLTNANLEQWRSRGATGFVAQTQLLWRLGGTQRFTGNPRAALTGPTWRDQLTLRASKVVARAAALGMHVYLGFYLSNYNNTRTPLAGWFDNSGWQHDVLPSVTAVASAAKSLGCAGVAFDEELYPQVGGAQSATWDWDFPGNTASQAAVRAAAKERGAQLMQALLTGFPRAKIVDYGVRFPTTWLAYLQRANGQSNAFANSVAPDFWNGLTSVPGWRSVLFLNATFYKDTGQSGVTWDDALGYEDRSLFSLFSRRLSNWSYAADRIAESPFAWVDNGDTSYYRARPPSEVASQFTAFRRWGMDGTFGLYEQQGLMRFDYEPYLSAFSLARQPGTVDAVDPQISLQVGSAQSLSTSAQPTTLRGSASDTFAVRVVRWRIDDGRSGTATLQPISGNPATGGDPDVDWTAQLPTLTSSDHTVTLTVESIKGLTASIQLPVLASTAS